MGPLHPEIEEFEKATQSLADHPLIKLCLTRDEMRLEKLSLEGVDQLIRDEVGYYFLLAAAGFNRTTLRTAMLEPAALLVPKPRRRAFAIRERLPRRMSFRAAVQQSIALRSGDLKRKRTGSVEALFRQRLQDEDIPLLMSPPPRLVPGILIPRRKPDGVYPDPTSGAAPRVYLEIKNIRRVADDIQKRLYELAEASIEMKLLYGGLEIQGFNLQTTKEVEANSSLRDRLRSRIIMATPTVVGFFICSVSEAGRYRPGAEAFVDRIFFQEEVDECLAFLRTAISTPVGR